MMEIPWHWDANCRGQYDMGYEGNSSIAEAKQVCARCYVRDQCLAFAMEMEKDEVHRFGVYGGLGPGERKKLAKRRRRSLALPETM